MSRRIASVSWGKDSTAMLHILIESGAPLDEVVFFDTGMEYDAVYSERDRTLPTLRDAGVEYTELRPHTPMWWDMLCRPVRSRETGEVHKTGYGWCGGPCRWGTRSKQSALDSYARSKGAEVYVGIAADETRRVERERQPWKLLPLVDAGMTEAECLSCCYEHGNEWDEGGMRLYDVLDRASCWCCRNKNLKELKAMKLSMPKYWGHLVSLERAIGEPMKRGGWLEEVVTDE